LKGSEAKEILRRDHGDIGGVKEKCRG